jgi:hypothetical protein
MISRCETLPRLLPMLLDTRAERAGHTDADRAAVIRRDDLDKEGFRHDGR